MMEWILRGVLVIMVWSDVLTTYLFFKKAKDYGYPRWADEETSPFYRFFVKKYGLSEGMVIAAAINPAILIVLTALISNLLSPMLGREIGLGVGHGIFYGMLFISVYRNYAVYYKCPARRYNEKVLGKPLRTHKR